MEPLVVLTRTNQIESIHHGYLCITDSNNKVIHQLGNPETKIFLRSSAKPFQAIPLVESGALEKFKLTSKELAIVCSSHSGQDFHRQTVASILHKIGLSEEYLDCGIANPYNKEANEALIQQHQRPSPLYNCCSGKHAGMLALCKFYDYPLKDYTNPQHPLQQLILKTLSEILDCQVEDIVLGHDGCGLPNFMLSLRQGAYLYARLSSYNSGHQQHQKALALLSQAMLSYPEMINGEKEFCTELMVSGNGKVIGKVGGEGIYCVSVPKKNLGIAVKIADGNERAVYPIIIQALRQLDILDETAIKKLGLWAYPPVKDHKGKVIGYTMPVFDLNNLNLNKVEIGEKLVFKGAGAWNH